MDLDKEELKKVIADLLAVANSPRSRRIRKCNAWIYQKYGGSELETLTGLWHELLSEGFCSIEKIRAAADVIISRELGRMPMYYEFMEAMPGHQENVADIKKAQKAEFESHKYTVKELQFMKEFKKAYLDEINKEEIENNTIH